MANSHRLFGIGICLAAMLSDAVAYADDSQSELVYVVPMISVDVADYFGEQTVYASWGMTGGPRVGLHF